MSIPNQFENMSDEELARWQAGWKTSTDHYILADKEWQRRAREEQHNLNLGLLKNQHSLNLQILKKQTSLMKGSIVVGFIGVILGAILGAYLSVTLSKEPQVKQKESLESTLQQKVSESSSPPHKGTNESLEARE